MEAVGKRDRRNLKVGMEVLVYNGAELRGKVAITAIDPRTKMITVDSLPDGSKEGDYLALA